MIRDQSLAFERILLAVQRECIYWQQQAVLIEWANIHQLHSIGERCEKFRVTTLSLHDSLACLLTEIESIVQDQSNSSCL